MESSEREARRQCGLILDTLGRDKVREVRDGVTTLNAAYEAAQQKRREDEEAAARQAQEAAAEVESKAFIEANAPDLTGGPGMYSLLVHGKGSNERVIPINDGLGADIALAGGWLFPSQRGEHLTPRAVGVMCSELLGEHVTLHMLRHKFATRAYRGSRNLRAVQKLLGHSSLAITERYLDCDADEMRAAMTSANDQTPA